MRFTFCTILIFLLTWNAHAQLQRLNYPLQKQNGQNLPYAWAGGLNNPQFSEADLDGDGIEDLLVFDRTGNVFLPFINKGTPNTIDFEYSPDLAANFPENAQKFVLLRDFNCDGIQDLFTYEEQGSLDGISAYLGFRNGSNELEFTSYKQFLPYNEVGQSTQQAIFISTIDLPAIDDIDGDGDLDVLTFNAGGGYVELFNNQSQESGWGCDSLRYERVDDCWGRFYESGLANSVDLSGRIDSCAGWPGWTPLKTARHAGSTLLTLDMDNDGDKELVLGDLSFEKLNMLTNGGNQDTAFITAQDPNFPSNSVPVDIPFFPAAFYLDVNNDGKKDFIASPNPENINAVNDKVAWLYLNTQTTAQPVFGFTQDDFLVDSMFDAGAIAAPAFVDFNGDNLMDLVVGNYGVFTSSGNFDTQLRAYENVGTTTNPIFRLVNSDFAAMQQYNFRRLVPTFGDLDNDGDFDLIIGMEDGQLLYLQNIGTSTAPNYATPFAYAGIDVGQNAVPQLVDADRDGDLDLIVGERNGNSNYFENTGTTALASFSSTATTATFGFIDAKLPGLFEGNSAPHLWDRNGSYRLLMGNESGEVWTYDGVEGNLSGNFNRIVSPYDALAEGQETILAMADLNGDGQPELAVGNKRGGLSLFTAPVPSALQNHTSADQQLDIFPNPARQGITIQLGAVLKADAQLQIYNNLGQLVFQKKINQTNKEVYVDTSVWPSGSYFVKIHAFQYYKTGTFLIK